MLDYWPLIQAKRLVGLLPETQLTLSVTLPFSKDLPASPYWREEAGHLVVTMPSAADLHGTIAKLAAVFATLMRLGADTTLPKHPITLEWALPEALLQLSYKQIAAASAAPDYGTFRNQAYQLLATRWQAVQARVQATFGVSAGFDVALVAHEQAVVGLRLTAVPVLINTETGLNAASITWLRGVLWSLFERVPQAELVAATAEWATANIQDADALQWTTRLLQGFHAQQEVTLDALQLPGYPALNLDSQVLLGTALEAGYAIDVLDNDSELIQLTAGAKRALVQKGRVTALNTAVAVAAAANKTTSKHLLGAAGLPTPRAAVYHTRNEALRDWRNSLRHKGLAVKPVVATNGRGVSVFPVPPSETEFLQAFDAAATFGRVLIELFFPGTTYRFFVLDGQVLAVLELTQANVVGDGQRSIAALVSQKNARRNPNYASLVLNQQNESILAAQGYRADSVPPRGHQVLLHFNSNFTVGGDGGDVTAELPAGYNALAVQATQALDLRLAGVDMLIANRYQPYTPEDKSQAALLSVTGTPSLWPHLLPHTGTPQPVAKAVLCALLH